MTNASWQNAFTEEGINSGTFAIASATKENNLKFNKIISSDLNIKQACKIHKYSNIYYLQRVTGEFVTRNGLNIIKLGSLEIDALLFDTLRSIKQPVNKTTSTYMTKGKSAEFYSFTVLQFFSFRNVKYKK